MEGSFILAMLPFYNIWSTTNNAKQKQQRRFYIFCVHLPIHSAINRLVTNEGELVSVPDSPDALFLPMQKTAGISRQT